MGVMMLGFVVDYLVVLMSLCLYVGHLATVLSLVSFNLVAALDLVTIHDDHMTVMLNVAGLMMMPVAATASRQCHRKHEGHSRGKSGQTNTRCKHIKSPIKRAILQDSQANNMGIL